LERMLKSKFDTENLSIKIGVFFSKLGISPNTWTLMSLFMAIFGFLSILSCRDLIKATGFFIFAGIIDAIDGAVARVTGKATNFGAFLDGVIDRYVEILLYLSLLIYGVNKIIIALLIFGAIMPAFVTAYSSYRHVITDSKEHRKMGGLIERAERLILVYTGMVLGIFNFSYLENFILITAILSNFTAIQRIFFVWKFKNRNSAT